MFYTRPDPQKHLLEQVFFSGILTHDVTQVTANRIFVAFADNFESARIALDFLTRFWSEGIDLVLSLLPILYKTPVEVPKFILFPRGNLGFNVGFLTDPGQRIEKNS